MDFPEYRGRRLRKKASTRKLVSETVLTPSDFVLPLFAVSGTGIAKEIAAMPGVFHYSPEFILEKAKEAYDVGVTSVLLFGIPDKKDCNGSESHSPTGPVQLSLKLLKENIPELTVMTDVCLCAYMDSGHCGVLVDDDVDNDSSLDLLSKMALSHARAGADFVAPSDMMDGRVGAIRKHLDANGYSGTGIMSYAVKYNSAFYGPFREVADSAPSKGDRKSYQMDPANIREALREVCLDEREGADMVMVKPALAYLDVIAKVKEVTTLPVVAYNVSGEYSMIKLAAREGLIDEKQAALEMLLSMKRAGADIIITYYAIEAAKWLR